MVERQPPLLERNRPLDFEVTAERFDRLARYAQLSIHVEELLLEHPTELEQIDYYVKGLGIEVAPEEIERFKHWQRVTTQKLDQLHGYMSAQTAELSELSGDQEWTVGEFVYKKLTKKLATGTVTLQREPAHFVLVIDDRADYEAAFRSLSAQDVYQRDIGLGFFVPHAQLQEHFYDPERQATATEQHAIPVVVVLNDEDVRNTILHERQHVVNHVIFGIMERRDHSPLAGLEDELIACVRSGDADRISTLLLDKTEDYVLQMQDTLGDDFIKLIEMMQQISDQVIAFELLITSAPSQEQARAMLAYMLVRTSIGNAEEIIDKTNQRMRTTGETPDRWYLQAANQYFDQVEDKVTTSWAMKNVDSCPHTSRLNRRTLST